MTGSKTSIFSVTSSILPPPFIITDDFVPTSIPDVKSRHQTRTITPPPYPYSTTSPGPPNPSPVTHSSETPKHSCKSGCGHKCRIFYHGLCLLDCIDPSGVFDDPSDPKPPPGPLNDPNKPTSTEPTSICTATLTVTDYWLSCNTVSSSSSSCTTTSSKVIKGCDVTATTTTTGGACRGTLDREADQGSDGDDTAHSRATITAGTTTVPSPKPSCSYIGPDPEGNIPEGYCICQGSLTFSELPGTSSCDYSTLPSKTVNPQQGSLAVTTSNCQVCTQVNANENNCNTITGCTPTTTPSPPTPTPTPIFTPISFYIGYTVHEIPGGGTLGGTTALDVLAWAIFSGPTGQNYDGCGTPDFTSPQIDGDPKPNILLGPFNAGDRTDCTYAWNKPDEIGGITCGIQAAVCRSDQSSRGCNGNRYSWVTLVTCDLA